VRILNADTLVSHGNVRGRKALVQILEAGLQAADPYHNVAKLLRREGHKLIVGNRDFEPPGDPRSGDEVIDLSQVGNIYLFGAGKGIQRVAKGIEDLLGGRLSGGHVIDKKGAPISCQRIEVTLGAHPVPDEDCVRGCRRILAMIADLKPDDLVFTVVCNGVSSLLTLPVPGVSLEDVRRTTYLMQIERGAFTGHLNPVRNHLDRMKGGKIAARLGAVRAIHIFASPPLPYDQLMHHNVWLHTLPGSTTFETAIEMLKRYDAWDAAPRSVRETLLRAEPREETVKADEYGKLNFRIFGIMPDHLGMIPAAAKKAAELGFVPHTLVTFLRVEASQAGRVFAQMAQEIETSGEPFEPPCALISGGELLVTVGEERGVGGRNQEYALAAALDIAESGNVVVGSVDSDGTDGPGTQFVAGRDEIPCLAGGIVDGETVRRAEALDVDIVGALKRHDTTPALWQLGSGIAATPNISINDLRVTLVLGRS
jgi:glycerate-2-kinase